jgi:hypothetical protein
MSRRGEVWSGMIRFGMVRLGQAGRGKDSFELVAVSANVKSGQCATGQGWVRRGMARTLLSWWRDANVTAGQG